MPMDMQGNQEGNMTSPKQRVEQMACCKDESSMKKSMDKMICCKDENMKKSMGMMMNDSK